MHKQRKRVESGSTRSEYRMACVRPCSFYIPFSELDKGFVLFWLTHHMVLLANTVIQKIPLSHQKQEKQEQEQ